MRYGIGLLLFVVLAAVLVLGSMRYGIGRLPGDIAVNRENFSLYIPITSGILVSLLLSLGLWLFNR